MEDLLELARAQRSSGKELEDVLSGLRGRGASIIDCLKIVREVEQVDLGRAKLIVDESRTWADAGESNRQLRAQVARTLKRKPREPACS